MELQLVKLSPDERGGNLRRVIQRLSEDWNAEWGPELAEQLHSILSDVNNNRDEYPPAEAIQDLRRVVPGYRDEFLEGFEQEFRQFPKMRIALRLGECIDEGVRPAEVANQLLVKERTPEQRAKKHRRRTGKGQQRRSQSGRSPHRHGVFTTHFVVRGCEPGQFPPPGTWDGEVRALWEQLGMRSKLPQAPARFLTGTACERQAHARRVVAAVLKGLWSLLPPEADTAPAPAADQAACADARCRDTSTCSASDPCPKSGADGTCLPKWDRRAKELRWGSQVFQFASQARNAMRLLDAFEEARWSLSIPTPFGSSNVEQTKETVRTLNGKTKPSLTFSVGESSKIISWTSRTPPNSPELPV
jgi:hypothetical protein